MSRRRYTLIRRMTSGDWADTFRGTADPGGAALVKLLLPRVQDDLALLAALSRAVDRSSQLREAGVVAPWELGEAGGRFLIAAPWSDGLDGQTILQRLTSKEALFSIPVT